MWKHALVIETIVYEQIKKQFLFGTLQHEEIKKKKSVSKPEAQ